MKDLISTIKNWLFNYYYVIGCREIPKDKDFSFSKEKFNILRHTRLHHYADPFLVKDDKTDKVYVFCEIIDLFTEKGKLGVTQYKDGKFAKVREILKEDFHLSYPNVFKIKDRWYMIPETNQSNQIRLYKSDNFPHSWKFEKTLKDNIKVADTSFLGLYDKNYVLYTYDLNSKKCLFFKLDTQSLELSPMQVKGNYSNIRPGGNALHFKNGTYRVLQDGTRVYGEFLRLFKADDSQIQDTYNEVQTQIIQADEIKTDKPRHYERIHTLNRCENYECIDLVYKKISLLRFAYGLLRYIPKHLTKQNQ